MKTRTIVLRSLLHRWRSHAGVVLGSAIGTAVVVGALVAGDSVHYSLARIASRRLGRTQLALVSQDRLFRAALADDLQSVLDADVAPGFLLRGVTTVPDESARANNVQVVGIDDRFWQMGPDGAVKFPVSGNKAVVNERLASILGLEIGDSFVLRVAGTERLPREFVISPEESGVTAMRYTVAGIASAEQFGSFGLRPSQVSPATVFVSLAELTRALEFENRANMILLAGRRGEETSAEDADEALSKVWKLADASLVSRDLKDRGLIELRSERIFLEPQLAEAALDAGTGAKPIATYFVNSIGCDGKETPYSFVSAPGAPVVPEDMTDDEIILNKWIAKDLGARRGDTVTLTYYVLGPMRKLREATSSFRVRAIVPIKGPAADRELVPLLPGLSDAGSCRDWDPGIAIDLDRIREKDEEYWDSYRGTPKAFVTLDAAAAMWTNRLGILTAVRYPAGEGVLDGIESRLTKMIRPSALGLSFRSVKLKSVAAVAGSVDIGQLFLGLSFFLVVAGLILTGLLFGFGVDSRAREAGTLLALGWPIAMVRRLYLSEGLMLAVVGGLVGVLAGIGYGRLVVYGLGTFWRGAIGTSSLCLNVRLTSVVIGMLSGVVVAGFTVWIMIRKRVFRFVRELRMTGKQGGIAADPRKVYFSMLASIVLMVAGIVVLVVSDPGEGKAAAGVFFGAGGLMLISMLFASNALMLYAGSAREIGRLSMLAMVVRNLARRKGRALGVIGMLACGVFMAIAVGANRHGPGEDSEDRGSGTGGFAFLGETALPIVHDLNEAAGRKRFGLDDLSPGVSFVQLRMLAGDDASCLNLNRTTTPTILGVSRLDFSARGAFSFVKMLDGVDAVDPWSVLDDKRDDGAIPAVADMSVITWGLGKALGDTLEYVDENGESFKLKLVAGLENSVFQGSVLISEKHFVNRFPSTSGARMFLADVPSDALGVFRDTLRDGMKDLGLELVRPAERLALFAEVENTYLVIFLGLGGLGLVLGTIGLGVVVVRNVLERRSEIAALRAVGFSARLLRRMIVSEHSLLLIAGLLTGGVSGTVATLPALSASGSHLALGSILPLVAGILLSGLAWTWLAAWLSMRGSVVGALRDE